MARRRQNRWIRAEKRLTRDSHPRTNHTKTTPMMAETTPTRRNVPSGVSTTCDIARLVIAGKAAKRIPSMANTKPIATRKSDIAANRDAVTPWSGYLGVAGGAAGV